LIGSGLEPIFMTSSAIWFIETISSEPMLSGFL
jgi:hypothetical protein